LLEQHSGDRASEANILLFMGGLEAMRGGFDEARALVTDAKDRYLELGQALSATDACGLVRGAIEMLAARPEAAEEALREGCEICMKTNETALLATRAAQLADALYAQGRYEEAEEWVGISREHAAPEDLDAQMHWHAVEAKLRARAGVVHAGQLAREAVALADRTDALNDRAKARMDLAEVLRLTGSEDEALEVVRRAVGLYELKGNAVAARRSRSLLGTIAVA